MINFNAANGFDVLVDIPSKDPEDTGSDLGMFNFMWDEDPKAMVLQLRELANFIEHHQAHPIHIEVD